MLSFFSEKEKPISARRNHLNKHQEQGTISRNIHTELLQQMDMIQLSESGMGLMRSIKPYIEKNADAIVDQFYSSILGVEKLNRIITTHSHVERLRTTLRNHLLEMFDGVVDEHYVAKRARIAMIHQKIGLEPKWYLAAFQKLQHGIYQALEQVSMDNDQRLRVERDIAKLLSFEQQIVLEVYEQAALQHRENQYKKIKDELKGNIAVISEEMASLAEQTTAVVAALVERSEQTNRTVKDAAAK